MHFRDIPQYPKARHELDVSVRDLRKHVDQWVQEFGLNLNPDFQRGHVWTEGQQVAYVEHILRGGEVGRNLIVNAPGWIEGTSTVCEMVDGKQRLTAMLRFVNNDLRVFGHTYGEFEGRPSMWWGFKWRVVDLDRKGVLDLYLSLNGGGTPHTQDELDRVRALRAQEG